jgi:transposase
LKRKPYPSDLTDAPWALLEPLLPRPRRRGRPRKSDLREIMNALFYHTREGGSWRALPHDFPPWRTVYNYFQWWTPDGTWQKILDALRPQVRAKARAGIGVSKEGPQLSLFDEEGKPLFVKPDGEGEIRVAGCSPP